MYKSNSTTKSNPLPQSHNLKTSNCWVCGESLIEKTRAITTVEKSQVGKQDNFIIHDDLIYYLNNRRTISMEKKGKNVLFYGLETKQVESREDMLTSVISNRNYFKDNKICTKYVNEILPFPQKNGFQIRKACSSMKRKVSLFIFPILQQNLKNKIISNEHNISKFDGCRPLIVSLECKCGKGEKIMQSQSPIVLDNNNLTASCICEKVVYCDQDDKLKENSQDENLCTNGCNKSREYKRIDQNKNSICFLLLSR